jgi:hypothetical protein
MNTMDAMNTNQYTINLNNDNQNHEMHIHVHVPNNNPVSKVDHENKYKFNRNMAIIFLILATVLFTSATVIGVFVPGFGIVLSSFLTPIAMAIILRSIDYYQKASEEYNDYLFNKK